MAEVMAALSLATDFGLGVELEHGLRSTLIAMSLAERLGVDHETAVQTYYTCLLLHVGCTTSAHVAVEVFGDGAEDLSRNLMPVLFGSPHELTRALMRTVAPGRPAVVRAAAIAQALPKAARAGPEIGAAARCEVAEMLVRRLGLGGSIAPLFVQLQERWDGKGDPGRARRDEIPLAMRIAHVARDADTHGRLGGAEHAIAVVRERAGRRVRPGGCGVFRRLRGGDRGGHRPARRLAADARVRACAALHAGGQSRRQRAGGDGRLRRSRLAVPRRALRRRGSGLRPRRPRTLDSTLKTGVRLSARRSCTMSAGSRCRSASGRSADR